MYFKFLADAADKNTPALCTSGIAIRIDEKKQDENSRIPFIP